MEVEVLGTKYKIYLDVPAEEDDNLEKGDGYVDLQTKKIVVAEFKETKGQTDDIQRYKSSVIRHELMHAFLYESGMVAYSNDERLVEWLEIQIPKANELFNELQINN